LPSPYDGVPSSKWLEVTRRLVNDHPLELIEIRDSCLEAWDLLWQTTIGKDQVSIPLQETNPPAIVVSYFFERLLSRVLASRFPGQWRSGVIKSEKDIVFENDHAFSLEIKCSGQLDTKIYGNRSTGQQAKSVRKADKPEKSGYYITINFYETTIMLIRFGWIDQEDWSAQQAQTGQAAGLPESVYQGKLIEISGEYRKKSPVQIIKGVGEKKSQELDALGIRTIHDLLCYSGSDKKITKLLESLDQDSLA
jgi:hypothetical protein